MDKNYWVAFSVLTASTLLGKIAASRYRSNTLLQRLDALETRLDTVEERTNRAWDELLAIRDVESS